MWHRHRGPVVQTWRGRWLNEGPFTGTIILCDRCGRLKPGRKELGRWSPDELNELWGRLR